MARKCPYCTPEDGELGNITEEELLGFPITFNKKSIDYFTVQIFLGWSSKKAVLCGNVFDKSVELRIKYCPVCGRDLDKYIKELEEAEVK